MTKCPERNPGTDPERKLERVETEIGMVITETGTGPFQISSKKKERTPGTETGTDKERTLER